MPRWLGKMVAEINSLPISMWKQMSVVEKKFSEQDQTAKALHLKRCRTSTASGTNVRGMTPGRVKTGRYEYK